MEELIKQIISNKYTISIRNTYKDGENLIKIESMPNSTGMGYLVTINDQESIMDGLIKLSKCNH